MVQRMNPVPSGKLKKFDPAQPRDFIDFTEYSKLTLKNVKDACEKFYNEDKGSCDILYDVTGPSCTADDQLAGMKVFRVRFLEPDLGSSHKPVSYSKPKHTSSKRESESERNDIYSSPASVKSKRKRTSILISKQPCPQNSMPVSISIGDLLQAGKLVAPTQE